MVSNKQPQLKRADKGIRSVYVGIGSNLGDALANAESALRALNLEPRLRLISNSPWYRSKAIGPAGQDDYVNGAALLHTTESAATVLKILQSIENSHGRVRAERWGPRTLDLDLLLYDMETIETETLSVPHPRICERNFVLRPLLDISPDLALPDGRTVAEILHIIGEDELLKLADDAPLKN